MSGTSLTGAAATAAASKTTKPNKTDKLAQTTPSPANVNSGAEATNELPVLGQPTGLTDRYIGKTGAQILLQMLLAIAMRTTLFKMLS